MERCVNVFEKAGRDPIQMIHDRIAARGIEPKSYSIGWYFAV
jgi:hypothetical protein